MESENKSENTVVCGTSCFNEHEKRNLTCMKSGCRMWMNSGEYLNCAVVASNRNDEGMTLQQIGDIFGITRMRICQLEKASLQKISMQ